MNNATLKWMASVIIRNNPWMENPKVFVGFDKDRCLHEDCICCIHYANRFSFWVLTGNSEYYNLWDDTDQEVVDIKGTGSVSCDEKRILARFIEIHKAIISPLDFLLLGESLGSEP
jgi:hypothetical protein